MNTQLFTQILTAIMICLLVVSCGGRDVNKKEEPKIPHPTNVVTKVSETPIQEEKFLIPVSQYPLPGDPIERKFVLVFDRNVHFSQEVSVEEYIKTEPPIVGIPECSENKVIFNVLQPVPKNIEQIEFCINPNLQSDDGIKINPKNLCYQFPVRRLEIIRGNFSDVTSDHLLFTLKFNGFVGTNEIKSFISLKDQNNADVEFEIKDAKPIQKTVDLLIKWTGKESYKLLIKPGYSDLQKKCKGQGAYFEFPKGEPLEVVECQTQSSTQYQIVFSKPISATTLYKCMQISSYRQSNISYSVVPLDWGTVQEEAVNLPQDLEKLSPEKVSKSWKIQLTNSFFSLPPLTISLKKYTWSDDLALLPEEYRWENQAISGGFEVRYAYWKDNGMDGVSCILSMPPVNKKTVMNFLQIEPPVNNISIQDREWGDIEIKGDWKTGSRYVLKWRAGLEWGEPSGSIENPRYQILEMDYVYALEEVPTFKALDFYNKEKFYIIPFHEKNYIRIGARNVPKGYIHVYQALTDNLSVWMGNVTENMVPFEINERTTKYLTTIPVEFPDSIDKASYVDIDLTEYLSGVPKGIFTLCLSDNRDPGRLRASWEPRRKDDDLSKNGDREYGWEDGYDGYYYSYDNSIEKDRFYQEVKGTRSAIRYILWTRLGVVSHWDDTSLVAFVHDLVDLSPQAGAVVSAYSIKNYKIAEGTTDANGIIKLSPGREDWGAPRLLTIRTEKDFSFVLLKPKPLPTLKDLEKYDNFDKDKYEAFIYTDRNLYRPGELIHARWIVRKNYGAEVVNAPLEMRFINPQNKVVSRKIVNPSEWGTGGEDIETETTYLTGAYTLGLYVPGGERLCGSIPVYVEDFVPDRIKTELSIPNDFWVVGDKQSFEVSSQYYVGPPAGDLPCKGKLVIVPTELEHENWKSYRFGNDEILKTVVMDLGTQNTNAEGKVTFTIDFDPPQPINKPVEIAIVSEVSEAGGRAVSSVKKVKGYPENILCGLGMEKIEDKLQVTVALVDKNFAPAPDEEVDVYLEKVEWRYVNRFESVRYNRTLPQWERFFTLIENQKITTKEGKATVQLGIPPYYSTYRVRAQRSSGKIFSEISFYCLPSKLMNLQAGPPELVKIHIEDKKWVAGEIVPVNIEVPFDGKAVAVIQGDKIWDIHVLDIISGKGSFSFDVKEEYFPNIWIGVSAIHLPTKEEMISPYSSFSFTKVEVEKPTRKMNITLSNIPEEIKPQSTVEWILKTTDNQGAPIVAELTVAVVDEGVHSILGYTLPDPYQWFGKSRYSPIRRVHYYDHVAYEYDPLSPSGDMIARQLSAGKPEIGESWIKPMALWSGTVRTDEEGLAKVSFAFPEFNGTVRIVAVGVNKDLMGSVENRMFVRRPCVIQTHLPRFLRPNDRAVILGRSLNSQENPLSINLSLNFNDVVNIEPSQVHWEAVPKGLSLSPELIISCLEGTKNAELLWKYNITDKSGGVIDEFSEQTIIPVRLPSIYEQRIKSHMVSPGESLHLDTLEFMDNPLLETEIKIGSNPFLRIEPALIWLRDYSYCCCEQKISRLYPLYVFRNFIKESMEDVISKESYDQLLFTLVNSIFAHQQANGGFSLWPYSNTTDIKASLHVAFLLSMINRDKSFPLPEKSYQRMLAFLQDVCSKGHEESVNNSQFKAYATLILALNGNPSACESVRYLLKGDYPRNLKVLLLMTADMCGVPKDEIKEYLKVFQWETSAETRACSWEYGSSQIRSHTLKLIATIIADEPLENIQSAQQPLIDYLSKYDNYTTYDLSLILMALDMSFRKMNIQPFESVAEVKVNDESQVVQGIKMFHRKKQGPVNIDINNKGNSPLFVMWTIRGVPLNPQKDAKAKNIVLVRTIFDSRGKTKIEVPRFSQGNVYVIKYKIRPTTDTENLIMTQLLPAGFEIENPRLKQEQIEDSLLYNDDKGSTMIITPEHVEIRDDKLIVAFPNVNKNNIYSYVCAVRAVTKGSFEFPGAYIEDMYKPEVFARLATEQIDIE